MSEADNTLLERRIKVGSRKSKLALIQTNSVIDTLKGQFPDIAFEIVEMSTTGDQILDKPLPKIGEKSLFTKELEVALEEKTVDFVVHSLKDLPTTLPPNLGIGAVCKREDARDAVMFHPKLKGKTLASLSKGSIIGTSSLRRMAQLRQCHSHLVVNSIRGNLNTRLAKLENSNIDDLSGDSPGYSALLLAAAGMERIGWKDKIGQILEPSEQLYAVGQGALAVECRVNDTATIELLSTLHDRISTLRVVAERSLLKSLGGGCSAPVAVDSEYVEGTHILNLKGGVWSLDGKKHILKTGSTCFDDISTEPASKKCRSETHLYAGIIAGLLNKDEVAAAEKLGEKVAAELKEAGAMEIMNEARAENENTEEAQQWKRLQSIPGGDLCIAARVAASSAKD